jgi:Mrp family chromosome partitioning ATPase
LSDYVLGKADIDAISYPCSLPNLTLIPAGEMPESDRSRIARSEAMVNTINNLGKKFDFLLLDIPAILKVKDSPILAGLCDSLCVVIRQGLTSVPAEKKALDEIEHLRIRGVILNKAHLLVPKSIVTNI